MSMAPEDPVRLLAHRQVVSVDLDATIREAAEILAEEEIGAVVVLDGIDVAGVLSERDIVRVLADGGDPDAVTAADAMTAEPMCADGEDSIRVTAERMLRAGIRHLPVLGPNQPMGMVSARDRLGALNEMALQD